jgi:hypothetical protein
MNTLPGAEAGCGIFVGEEAFHWLHPFSLLRNWIFATSSEPAVRLYGGFERFECETEQLVSELFYPQLKGAY